MIVRKNVLWRIPAFCMVAGFAGFYMAVFLISKFAVGTGADGVVFVDQTITLIIYGGILLLTLLIGRVTFCHNMTRKEIFWSSTIAVGCQIAIAGIERALQVSTGPLPRVLSYLGLITEWGTFFQILLHQMTNQIWLSACVRFLTPYLFVLFGKEQLPQEIEKQAIC